MIKMPNHSQEPPATSKSPNQDLKDMYTRHTSKIEIESQKIDHGWIKDQCQYSNKEKSNSGTFSILQCPNQDLKDMHVLFTLKFNIDSLNNLWQAKVNLNWVETKTKFKNELLWADLSWAEPVLYVCQSVSWLTSSLKLG